MIGRWRFVWFLLLSGCATSVPTTYLAMNDNCRCERFIARDSRIPVRYLFSARYSVDENISTAVTIEIQNDSPDTIDLSLAYVKINSRNVPYQYNGKFIPIDVPFVRPAGMQTLNLKGSSARIEADPWMKIAGETLEVTLKGMRIHQRTLDTQTVEFIPRNPKLG